MLRKILQTSSSSDSSLIATPIAAEAKNQGDYALYLLADNNPESLAKAQHQINDGNAVLLYPDPADKSSDRSESRKYKACFIQNGELLKHPASEEKIESDKIVEVAMGNRIVSAKGTLPSDITQNLPNVANLIKAALARAGIQLTPLLQTPNEVIHEHLFPKMNPSSLAAFANSSFYAYKLAQPELDQRAVKKLFIHILGGETAEVKKMLDANPGLALAKWQAEKEMVITNKAGQRIQVERKTAYQLALGEEDNEMAAVLKACIVKVANEKETDAQFHAQFPAGWKEEEEKRWAPIFAQLGILTQAIRRANVGDITLSGYPEYKLTVRENSNVTRALAQFKSLLDATLNEVVTTGRHFNPNLLQQGFQIYDDHYKDYFGNNWDHPRAMLFWQRAVGSIERLMPANYVQAFCDGINSTEEKLRKRRPQGRSFKFVIFDSARNVLEPVDFYPLSRSLLGTDFAIYAGREGWAGGKAWPSDGWGHVPFRSFCQTKTASIQSLCHTEALDGISRNKSHYPL